MSECPNSIPRSPALVEQVSAIARSRAVGIWRIKRAKVILGLWDGKSIDELVTEVRVPPTSIERCRDQFAVEGIAYFDQPDRAPTARESRVERMLLFLEDPPGSAAKNWDRLTVHYIGRDYTAREIARLRKMISSSRGASRSQLVLELCNLFKLRQSNGQIKRAAGAHVLRRMAMDNLIDLPLLKGRARRRHRRMEPTIKQPSSALELSLEEIPKLRFERVSSSGDSEIWRELMERFHYIDGYRIYGHQIRYLMYGGTIVTQADRHQKGHLLGALAFGASAWRLTSRDEFIGWSEKERIRNLHFVVSNVRFLILPWIRSPNLASRILGAIVKQLPRDWEARYHFRPVMLETFVQLDRFSGTCYRAANWIRVGTTNGYSLYNTAEKAKNPRKAIFVYPLRRDFRRVLCRAD